MALANAPSRAVADQCPVVKTRTSNRRRVLTWFASRWRNHQPKRAEKPRSKFNLARGWTALPRGRRLRLPRRMASGSRQPPQGVRPMSARERELGELPSPKFVLVQPQGWAGTFCIHRRLPACPSQSDLASMVAKCPEVTRRKTASKKFSQLATAAQTSCRWRG